MAKLWFEKIHPVDDFKAHNRKRRAHARRMNFGLKPKFKITGNNLPQRRKPNNNPSTRGTQLKTHK